MIIKAHLSEGQVAEYDTYSFQLLNMLKLGSSQIEICEYLDQIRFEFMALKMTDENKAENQFYSWAFLQTWHCQRSVGTNLRVVDESIGFSEKPYKRKISPLELVQQILQDWDPLEKSEIFQNVVDGEIMKQQPRDVCHEVT